MEKVYSASHRPYHPVFDVVRNLQAADIQRLCAPGSFKGLGEFLENAGIRRNFPGYYDQSGESVKGIFHCICSGISFGNDTHNDSGFRTIL